MLLNPDTNNINTQEQAPVNYPDLQGTIATHIVMIILR